MNSKFEELRLGTVVSQLASGTDVAVLGGMSSGCAGNLRRNGFRVVECDSVAETGAEACTTVVIVSPELMNGRWAVLDRAEIVVVHAPDRHLVEEVESSLRLAGFRTHPRQFKYCGYSAGDRRWPLFIGQRAGRIGAGLLHRPLGQSALDLQRLSFVGLFARPGDRAIILGGTEDELDVLRASTACSAVTADGENLGPTEFLDFVLHPNRAFSKDSLTHAAKEAAGRLTPGGRFAAFFPIEGIGDRVRQAIDCLEAAELVIEKVFVQDATAMCLHDVTSVERPKGDWCIIVAGTDPLRTNGQIPFQDTIYPYPNPSRNLLSFDRDYENPWLMRSFFGMSVRTESRSARLDMADRITSASSKINADRGSALCVKGYDILSSGRPCEKKLFVEEVSDYLSGNPDSPHALRWQVSLAFLCGLLLQDVGELDQAVGMYSRVIEMPWTKFSPTLGTKAAEAAYRAGMILYRRGDREGARGFWRKGVDVVSAIMESPLAEIVGDPDRPLPDALPESIHALGLARRCADCLRATHPDDLRSADHRQAEMAPADEMRHLSARLEDLEAENRNLKELASRLSSELDEARARRGGFKSLIAGLIGG